MSDNTQLSPAVSIQRAKKQADEGMEASDGCFICQKKLWLSFFFDEPKHDAEKEKGTEILSNIGKLLYSHADEKKQGIYRLYYNGLGVEFREPNIARMTTAKETTLDEAEGIAKDKVQDIAKGEGKKLLQLKNWGPELLGLVTKLGIEASWLRDKPVVSQITLSGVKTRVDNALANVDQIVKDQKIEVTRIYVAVFGAGLGGAMARLFINKLTAQCRRDGDTLYYPTLDGEAALEFRFLGLLDCISSTADGNPVTDFLAGKATLGMAALRVDGPMGIARTVAQTVHYVAGHEVRLTQRVDSVAKAEGGFSEIVLPGAHGDIVGGYANDVQGRSNQLARHALVELHGKAYGAGVPVLSMTKLENVDFKLYNDFQFTRKVVVHGSEAGARAMAWRYGATHGTLEEQLVEHMRRFISWLRIRHDDLQHPKRPPQAVYDLIDQQINRLRAMLQHPRSTYRLTKDEVSLLDAWGRPVPLDDYALALFDEFVHDELYLSIPDQMAANASHNGYFKLRGIDRSDELAKEKADVTKLPFSSPGRS